MNNPMDAIRADLFGEATNAQRAKKMLDDHAVTAAGTLVDLAANGSSERIRLQASEAILNRVLGPIGRDEQADSLVDFLAGIQSLAATSYGDET